MIRDFPVFFGTVDTPAASDLTADMEWAIDAETGVIQLTKLIPLEVLYQEQHVDGCGATWRKYYEDFGDYVIAQGPHHVFEIGGGAGALAKTALARGGERCWTIVEPNPTLQASGNLRVKKGFFERSLMAGEQIDAVVFSQVMEHVYDPRRFLQDISEVLQPGERLIFAYPNLALWLERKYTNALNFEHTMLLTDRHLDSLLPEYGFRITDKRPYLEHSFFYVAEKAAGRLKTPPMPNMYRQYKRLFTDFVDHHVRMVAELNALMQSSTDEFYLFGAHIFSTFLFAFGLDRSRISGILDNSPTKRGRRLYGTDFIVNNPEVLRRKSNAAVILRAGHFNQEIRDGIVHQINSRVRFV